MEYTFTGGTSITYPTIENSLWRFDTKFGINTALTVGGGLWYMPHGFDNSLITPYASGSFRLTSDILLGGEYYLKSGFQSSLNITGPAGILLDAEYDHPFTSETILFGDVIILDQRRLQLTTPLPFLNGSLRCNSSRSAHR